MHFAVEIVGVAVAVIKLRKEIRLVWRVCPAKCHSRPNLGSIWLGQAILQAISEKFVSGG